MNAAKTLFVLSLCTGLIAACDRAPAPDATRGASQPAAGAPAQPQTSGPTTPANIEPPKTVEEKKEGANPVQGQVDPKEGEQRKDFKQSGDERGPTSAETKPRS